MVMKWFIGSDQRCKGCAWRPTASPNTRSQSSSWPASVQPWSAAVRSSISPWFTDERYGEISSIFFCCQKFRVAINSLDYIILLFKRVFFGDRKNPIFRSTSNRGDGIVTYHSSSWESWDDFFKAKGCQIWGISWGKSGKSLVIFRIFRGISWRYWSTYFLNNWRWMGNMMGIW